MKQSSLTSGIDWKSIKPWIGNRYAVAVVESAQTLNGVILLSVNDVAEMKYFMAKNYPNASYRLIKEFLVIAESKSILDLICQSLQTFRTKLKVCRLQKAKNLGEQLWID